MNETELRTIRLLAMVAGVVAAVWAAPAAADDLGEMFKSFTGGLEQVPGALQILMYALGLWFFIWGVIKFKRAGDNPQQQSSGGAWITLLVGVGLVAGPHIIEAVLGTFALEGDSGRPNWGSGS